MRSSFAARRKASVIGQDNEATNIEMSGSDETQASVVKKPPLKPKSRPSSSRASFAPSVSDEPSEIFTVKKSTLSQQAIQRNALRKSALAASSDRLPIRQQEEEEERPSYSREYLAELKHSVPGTPQEVEMLDTDASDTGGGVELDIASKFGTSLARYEERERNSAIPTDAEIQEKKARRARLAKEAKYNTKHSDDSNDEEDDGFQDERQARDSDSDEFRTQHDRINLSTPSTKYPETRLTHDDEDILEDFDAFVEDPGRINLTGGRRAEREQKARQREQIRDLIDQAEGTSDSDANDGSDSEKERREEYEMTQTRKGMEGLLARNERDRVARPRTPPRITPLPSLSGVAEKLRERLAMLEKGRKEKLGVLEGIEREREEIREREGEIKRLLAEAGE
ncbi:MAG: hypothetical protein LQ340_000246, partial [Diploschistes diacapsis]